MTEDTTLSVLGQLDWGGAIRPYRPLFRKPRQTLTQGEAHLFQDALEHAGIEQPVVLFVTGRSGTNAGFWRGIKHDHWPGSENMMEYVGARHGNVWWLRPSDVEVIVTTREAERAYDDLLRKRRDAAVRAHLAWRGEAVEAVGRGDQFLPLRVRTDIEPDGHVRASSEVDREGRGKRYDEARSALIEMRNRAGGLRQPYEHSSRPDGSLVTS